MSTITTINASDLITNSRAVINTNFSNLNTDKIETSYLDTDTALAANSDTKIATQKAVKAYVDSGGNVNASETAKGIVEEATDAEVTAGTATGGTGAKLFITPAKLATRITGITAPVTNVYSSAPTSMGDSTTQFDITNTSGTTYRYTYDGTGTDPSISAANLPVNTIVNIQAQNFASANKGVFIVTASGTNYFEVTNASGTAEINKTIGTGYMLRGVLWTKPTGLKYVVAEVVGGGGGGGGTTTIAISSAGGGGGGYSKEVILAASLTSTVGVLVGTGGAGGVAAGGTGSVGRISGFGGLLQATGGDGGTSSSVGGSGGIGSNGGLNVSGGPGGPASTANTMTSGCGGNSVYGGGAPSVGNSDGTTGSVYGGGGSGGSALSDGNDHPGGTGATGVVIVTEYYV